MEKNKLLNTDFLLRITANGELYYMALLGNIRKKDNDTYYNVCSPFRNDRNPSMSIFRNKSTGKWMFKDFGASGVSGDMFNFAALYHRINLREFRNVLNAVYEDMRIDDIPSIEIEKFLQDRGHNIVFNHLIDARDSWKTNNEVIETDYSFELIHSIPEAITFEQRAWLKMYGVSLEVMQELRVAFIDGYIKRFKSGQIKECQRPSTEVWIAYNFGTFAKIYRPDPKRFWFLNKPKNTYLFGSLGKNDQLTTTLLVGGEKDVLTLRSRGIPAISLNSETAALTDATLKELFYDNIRLGILYDIDDTGIKEARKIKQQHNFLPIVKLPDWLKEKGGKDASDFFLMGGTIEELNDLVTCAFEHVQILPDEFSEIDSKERLPIRTASQRIDDAKNLPPIKPHFDVLMQSNELVIFFGCTGKGKSILAVALADAISKGSPFLGLENAHGPLVTVYFDFELSDQQFLRRYSDNVGNDYPFSKNLFIDNIDLGSITTVENAKNLEVVIIERIKNLVEATGAQVVVIDNITFLSAHTAEDSQVALKLMKALKDLKSEKNITVLVIAHRPKRPYNATGISLQDLAGSKHLSNFADSVFAIGESKQDKNFRYLIQVKPSRSGEIKYDSDNVIVCELIKAGTCLTFDFIGFTKETEHTCLLNSDDEAELLEKAKELRTTGMSYEEIGKAIGRGRSTIHRWLKELPGENDKKVN